jgi:hypothetical protein
MMQTETQASSTLFTRKTNKTALTERQELQQVVRFVVGAPRKSSNGIRPQYQFTPKVNPTLSFNYRKNKMNMLFSGRLSLHANLNKNEFVTRTYDDGTIIQQQTKRNRNTHFANAKAGIDWYINDQNMLTVSGLYGLEKIIDNGDQPFFNSDLSERLRLWQFLEDELKTTVMASAAYQHKFKQLGHVLNAWFQLYFS